MRPWEPITKLSITRRDLLRYLVMLTAWVPTPFLLAAVRNRGNPSVPPAFRPFLDTLLPQDESPSATQLGVGAAILSAVTEDPKLSRLIELGCAWLEQQANKHGDKSFTRLNEAQRTVIVTTAEQSSKRTLPRVFFETIRRQTFQHYYAHPEAWPGLGYSGPPQPVGFPDHDQPPVERAE